MDFISNRRRWVAFAVAACGAAGLNANAWAQQALDTVAKRGSLRIGIPVDVPPFGFLDADKAPIGLDVDMARIVAQFLGVKAELAPVASSERIASLQQRKVDVVISTLGKTPEREKLIDYSETYGNFDLVVFGDKSLNVSSIADLAGLTIAVTKGSVEDTELTKTAPPKTDILRMDTNADTVAAYVGKKATLMASGVGAGAAMIAKNPELNVDSKFILKENPIYVGLPKGEAALMEKVNAAIQSAKAAGELRAIKKRWFSRAGLKS